MASLLAMHAALAHSPDLVRYLPESLLDSPAACSLRSAQCVSMPGDCPGKVLPPPAFSGCRTSGYIEPPILTDSLYQEYDPSLDDRSPDAPADALKCLPKDESQDGRPQPDRHA